MIPCRQDGPGVLRRYVVHQEKYCSDEIYAGMPSKYFNAATMPALAQTFDTCVRPEHVRLGAIVPYRVSS
jgi:hypothetical protein